MRYERFFIRLKPLSPLLIGQTQAMGNYRMTGEIIPGRTWRGALAANLREVPHTFAALFEGPDPVHFGALYPTITDQPRLPLPTLYICEHNAEFDGDPTDNGPHIFDTLARQYTFEVAAENSNPGYIDELRCPMCGEDAAAFENRDVVPTKVITTHVAINRQRRAAERSQLYSREGALLTKAGEAYGGWVDVPETLITEVQQVLTRGRQLRIGGNRSRGMGLVEIESLVETRRSPDDLRIRVEQFNHVLEAGLNFYADVIGELSDALTAARECRFFTLDLHDEAIFLHHGFPSVQPQFSNVSVVRRWIRSTLTGGWHVAAGLPRRSQLSVSGVFLCCFEGLPDFDWLYQLEMEGVGIQREQGYGQITVCDPMHGE